MMEERIVIGENTKYPLSGLLTLPAGTTLYYFKETGEHPAFSYLTATEKPILILQGEKDFQATAKKDFAAYKQLLAGKGNVTFRLYENLNHCLCGGYALCHGSGVLSPQHPLEHCLRYRCQDLRFLLEPAV